MNKRFINIICIMANILCISGYAATNKQLADTTFFGAEQKLQDVQHEFFNDMQLCFDPFLLESPKKDALSLIKRMWKQLESKAKARIELGDEVAAMTIIAIMQQFVGAMQKTYQKVLLFALGYNQSSHAVIKKGLSFVEQQDMMLTALLPLVGLVLRQLKMQDGSKVLVIDNAMISTCVFEAYKQQVAGWWIVAYFNGQDEAVKKLISVDLGVQYEAIANAYFACMHDYAKLFNSSVDSSLPSGMYKSLEALAGKIKETIGSINQAFDSAEDESIRKVFHYMASYLERVLPEVEILTICNTFTEPMLAELFALHLAIIDSPGFVAIKEKNPDIAESYARLTDTFFKHQPNNALFSHQVHKTMQTVRFQANAKKTHVPVGIIDYIKMFWRVVHVVLISTSNDPLLDTLDQMLVVLHTCAEWHSADRKQAKTLLEWLLPKGICDHPMLQPLLQNNNILSHIAAAGAIPAGAKVIQMVQSFFSKKAVGSSENSVAALLQLAKDNPVAFGELTKQEPKILQRLAVHFVPTMPAAAVSA